MKSLILFATLALLVSCGGQSSRPVSSFPAATTDQDINKKHCDDLCEGFLGIKSCDARVENGFLNCWCDGSEHCQKQ